MEQRSQKNYCFVKIYSNCFAIPNVVFTGSGVSKPDSTITFAQRRRFKEAPTIHADDGIGDNSPRIYSTLESAARKRLCALKFAKPPSEFHSGFSALLVTLRWHVG
jgi:hypothetical protein